MLHEYGLVNPHGDVAGGALAQNPQASVAQSAAVNVVIDAIPGSGRAAKQTDVLSSRIARAHTTRCDPTIPPGSEIGSVDARLRQLADGTAEAQQMFSLTGRWQLSPSLQKSSGSDQRGNPVAFQNRLLNDSVVECVLQHTPCTLLIF